MEGDFDPDAYLSGTQTATVDSGFDPDAYLSQSQSADAGFDPDAYLGNAPKSPIPETDKALGFFSDPGKYLWRQTPEAKQVAEGVRATLSGLVPQSWKAAAEFATPAVGAVEDIIKAGQAVGELAQGKPVEQINRELYPEAYRYENFGQQPLKQQVETVGSDVANVVMGGLLGKGLVRGAVSEPRTTEAPKPETPTGAVEPPPVQEASFTQQIEQPRVQPVQTADVTRAILDRRNALIFEAQQLGQQAEISRQMGQRVHPAIENRLAEINQELNQPTTGSLERTPIPEGGEQYAQQSSNAQMEARGTPFGVEAGAESNVPRTGYSDYAQREAQGAVAGRELPQEPVVGAAPQAAQEPIISPEDVPYAGGTAAPAPKPSKIGKSIEAKAVEAKLTQGFSETAEYDPITIADQAKRATDFVRFSPADARAVVRGDASLPEGLRGTSLVTAMEEELLRKPDPQLAYELANSPLVKATSAAAQEMRLMAERVPDSLSAKFAEIQEARRAGSELRGETPERLFKEINQEIVKQSSKRPTWEAFVRDITC